MTPLEIAARLFRPTLWEPEGTPVLAAEIRHDGVLVVATGPEKHTLGTPRRVRKVFVVRTYRAHPAHAPWEEWACDGFSWKKTHAEALECFRKYLAPPPPFGPADLKPGARVRCEYRNDHEGTVLADDDPRAWAGTIAFGTEAPDPAAVRAHVAKHHALGTFKGDNRRPVLWDFGKVYWDTKLSPVAATAADRAAVYGAPLADAVAITGGVVKILE